MENSTYLYIVDLISIAIGTPGDSNPLDLDISYGPSVVIDSGSSVMSLPNGMIRPIYDRFQVSGNTSRLPLIDCSYRSSGEEITFQLGESASAGANFSVPIADVITESPYTDGCVLQVADLGTDFQGVVLGDNILRSIYVVFDADNSRIAIAPINRNATTSDIKPIMPGDPIPGST